MTHRFGPLELERGPLVEGDRVVLASGDDAERPRWSEVTAVDRPRLAGDVAVGGSSVGQENMAELLSPFADTDDALIVRGPGQVIDWS